MPQACRHGTPRSSPAHFEVAWDEGAGRNVRARADRREEGRRRACGKAVLQTEVYISVKIDSSGASCSVMLSLRLSRNCFASFILGTLGLLLYQVLLCQRQTVMKSSRHLIVRKPLHAPAPCCVARRAEGTPVGADRVLVQNAADGCAVALSATRCHERYQ